MNKVTASIFFNQTLSSLTTKCNALLETSDPFFIGIVGPSASGKSTLAAFLRQYIEHIFPTLSVSIIALDNFIYPNHYLIKHDLMSHKGFPESFNAEAIEVFVNLLKKNNQSTYEMPFYSHTLKDISSTEMTLIPKSRIYIFEGVSLFYWYKLNNYCLSSTIDWSIYLDIPLHTIKERSLARFFKAYVEAKKLDNPPNFFKPLVNLSFNEVHKFAENLWNNIDVPTIEAYIEPQKKLTTEVVTVLPSLAELTL